ncbi:MAG TPA: endo-1,4-beta-xylanase [Polyangia bacterium]
MKIGRSLVVGVALGAAGAVAGCIIHDPGAAAGGAVGGNLVPPSSLKPMRQSAAAAHRRIGTAVMSYHIADGAFRTLVAREFDSLSPENEMKWASVEPRPGAFEFAAADRLVDFAEKNNMRMRGHTLVWHQQLAFWVKGLKPDALRAAMARHIQNVAGHWKGRIGQWDVVNEALANGDSGQLRDDSPFTALGPTFIDEAFRQAHAADPQALLFYNDYEIEGVGPAKSEAAFALCKRLKESGVPIHGVGFQMHVDPRQWPSADSIRQNIERYAALGLDVEFTEMDVAVGALPGDINEKLQRQREITHDIVAACVAVDRCTGITLWGVSDRDSWLSTAEWSHLRGRGPHYPLAFNANLEAKPMVAGILDAFEKK